MNPRWRIAQVTTSTSGRTAFYKGSDKQVQDEHKERHTGTTESTMRPLDMRSKIESMDKSLQWVLEDVTLPDDNGSYIASQIIQRSAKCISDGSTKDELGTAAALSITKEDSKAYKIKNRTPGLDEDQHSYRSELCGILANILMVNIITQIHGIEEGKVTIASDNESALWMSFGADQVTTSDSCFDIIRVIQRAVSNSSIEWEPKHVHSHQDKKRKTESRRVGRS